MENLNLLSSDPFVESPSSLEIHNRLWYNGIVDPLQEERQFVKDVIATYPDTWEKETAEFIASEEAEAVTIEEMRESAIKQYSEFKPEYDKTMEKNCSGVAMLFINKQMELVLDMLDILTKASYLKSALKRKQNGDNPIPHEIKSFVGLVPGTVKSNTPSNPETKESDDQVEAVDAVRSRNVDFIKSLINEPNWFYKTRDTILKYEEECGKTVELEYVDTCNKYHETETEMDNFTQDISAADDQNQSYEKLNNQLAHYSIWMREVYDQILKKAAVAAKIVGFKDSEIINMIYHGNFNNPEKSKLLKDILLSTTKHNKYFSEVYENDDCKTKESNDQLIKNNIKHNIKGFYSDIERSFGVNKNKNTNITYMEKDDNYLLSIVSVKYTKSSAEYYRRQKKFVMIPLPDSDSFGTEVNIKLERTSEFTPMNQNETIILVSAFFDTDGELVHIKTNLKSIDDIESIPTFENKELNTKAYQIKLMIRCLSANNEISQKIIWNNK